MVTNYALAKDKGPLQTAHSERERQGAVDDRETMWLLTTQS